MCAIKYHGKEEIGIGVSPKEVKGTVLEIQNFLTESGYSPIGSTNRHIKMTSDRGDAEIYLDEVIVVFHYYSPAELEQNRPTVNSLKEMIETRKQRLEERAAEIEVSI